MPIYEFVCRDCLTKFEDILSFEESEKPHPCPNCSGMAAKVPSCVQFRMDRIYDNAEYGPRAFFGEQYAKHEEWKNMAERSEMEQIKRRELIRKGELNDFLFQEGKYEVEEGQKPKTIEEV